MNFCYISSHQSVLVNKNNIWKSKIYENMWIIYFQVSVPDAGLQFYQQQTASQIL